MTVQDAISKSEVVVKVTSGSQLKKLPPEAAQRIAIRLKSTASGGQAGANAQGQNVGNGQGAPSGSGTYPDRRTKSQCILTAFTLVAGCGWRWRR